MDTLPNQPGVLSERIPWIDWIKGVAILMIFFNHLVEEVFMGAHLGNPHPYWPELAVRIHQWLPLPIHSFSDYLANATRYVGFISEQAVSYFLIISGVGLTRSALRSGHRPTYASFLKKRLLRIYPIWIVAHFIFLIPPATLGWRVSLGHPEFYLSLLGLRLTSHQMHYGIPAWWFITLLIQFYLIFPFLFTVFQKLGRTRGLLLLCFVGLLCRGVGLLFIQENLYAWARGTIVISRLPELAFGMWFGFLTSERGDVPLLRKPLSIAFLALGWLVAMPLGLHLLGVTFFPLLTGACGFCLLYAVVTRPITSRVGRGFMSVLTWLGKHSLSLFLVHHPIAFIGLHGQTGAEAFPGVFLRFAMVAVLTFVAALFLERLTRFATELIARAANRFGKYRVVAFGAGGLSMLVLLMLPAELWLRSHAPQDVPDFGWSEKPSLQPDEKLGFRLKNSSRTQLRWESYDYEVVGNAEGFPGPDFAWAKPAGVFRIMTLGDAYTSAEGVDTHLSWPRLLETNINEARSTDRSAEVINFGITGFGPSQYATITEDYAPRLQPDLIIIGFFINDFWDVQIPIDEFRDMIGFDRPPIDSWLGIATGRHLFRYFRGHVLEATFERLTGKPSPHTRFFLQQDVMDPEQIEAIKAGQSLVRDRFRSIDEVARRVGAQVIVMAIPAPIQVSDRKQLKFLRPQVDFDSNRFDLDQPQRLAAEVSAEFGFQFVDLRPALCSAKSDQPYQPNNLHWTTVGHEVTAATMGPIVQAFLGDQAATAD